MNEPDGESTESIYQLFVLLYILIYVYEAERIDMIIPRNKIEVIEHASPGFHEDA